MIEHLYFDENMPREMEGILRGMGYTVHTVYEVGTSSEDDATHLRLSAERDWVLVTQDRRDFRRLHWLWTALYKWGVLHEEHGGILTIYQTRLSTPYLDWAAAIHDFLQPRDTLRGEMRMWRPSQGRWEEEPVKLM
ncbi:MAG: DUF5615 family PIN-like protein [Chloroflexota bacterium]|nr:DUF5615 family PIN-like protein [Chloroflexota bacterium]MYC08148.1 hypothetical protein [Chloroflexota bacterium]